MKNNFFRIYDKLIEKIPSGIKIVAFNQGEHWTGLRTQNSLGIAKTIDIDSRPRNMEESYLGEELRTVARLIKSWNLKEASFGLAAINAYYNSKENADRLNILNKNKDAFLLYKEEVEGKKVTVVGHFPFIEKELGDICDLRILERNPRAGDYPDSASEVLLPESDYIFITSCTLVNKTFPRLFELGKNGKIIMVGPSTPMSEILLEEGIYDISGFIPMDIKKCMDLALTQGCRSLFGYGEKVSLNKI